MQTIEQILGFFVSLYIAFSSIFTTLPPEEPIDTDTYTYDTRTQDFAKKDNAAYETEATEADSCTSYESWDEEEQSCYYECASNEECAEIEKLIEDELDSYEEGFEERDTIKEDSSGDEIENKKAVYTVLPGEKIVHASGEKRKDSLPVWDRIAMISPDYLTDANIDTFAVYEAPSDIIAYVLDENSDGKFLLAVNMTQYNDIPEKEQYLTLVHELSHTVTLNKKYTSQVTTCKGYDNGENCFKKGSPMDAFVREFGKNINYTKNNFVSEYAATSPEEDIAETISYAVVHKGELRSSIRDKKIAFVMDNPDLAKLIHEFKQSFASQIIHAKKLSRQ